MNTSQRDQRIEARPIPDCAAWIGTMRDERIPRAGIERVPGAGTWEMGSEVGGPECWDE